MLRGKRLINMCQGLSEEQVRVRIDLLTGRSALLGYLAVKPHPLGWSVHSTDEDASGEHTVTADLSVCSCPDNKYRKRECKHLRALRAWLRPAVPGQETKHETGTEATEANR